MKTTKPILACILVFMLVFALCGCGDSNSAPADGKTEASAEAKTAETQAAATEAPATEAPDYTGTYTSFAYSAEQLDLGDYLISSEAMEGSMSFTLKEGGSGTAALNDDENEISWKTDGEKLTITSSVTGQDMNGTIKDGVIDISMETDSVTGHVYLAKPDADTSSYKVLSLEEAMAMKISQTEAE